jgi:hypothetical protein
METALEKSIEDVLTSGAFCVTIVIATRRSRSRRSRLVLTWKTPAMTARHNRFGGGFPARLTRRILDDPAERTGRRL